jgi:GTP-binding protein
VINKVDRENARPHKVLDMVFDLFVALKANDEQLDFPIIYASAKNGFAMREIHENSEDMTPLFEAIVKFIPPPPIATEAYFQMLVSNLHYSDYLGRIALGRIVSGRVAVGDDIVCIHRDGRREHGTSLRFSPTQAWQQVETQHASAGDIVGLCGFEEVLYRRDVDRSRGASAPAICRYRSAYDSDAILVNDSPFAGAKENLSPLVMCASD